MPTPARARGGDDDAATALFQTWTDKPHPVFGTGALLAAEASGGLRLESGELPQRRRHTRPDCHQLGAWCHRADWGLAFATFLPALVFQRGGPYATNLFESLVWHSASRAQWAHALLTA